MTGTKDKNAGQKCISRCASRMERILLVVKISIGNTLFFPSLGPSPSLFCLSGLNIHSLNALLHIYIYSHHQKLLVNKQGLPRKKQRFWYKWYTYVHRVVHVLAHTVPLLAGRKKRKKEKRIWCWHSNNRITSLFYIHTNYHTRNKPVRPLGSPPRPPFKNIKKKDGWYP